MLKREEIHRCNQALLQALSEYLNRCPDFIAPEGVEALCRECGVDPAYAFSLLLAAALGLAVDEKAEDRAFFEAYFPAMVECLSAPAYRENPYYKNIRIPEKALGGWSLKTLCYKPCEAFVCGDMQRLADGRIIPKIGFFTEPFLYPAVLENGREWMLITPNEINTMAPAVNASHGRVLSFGLGLGYFPYMASQRAAVESVTVVERDERAIALFRENILPQFPHGDKIRLVRDDAFRYARERMGEGGFDLVFTDLWHDVSDGLPLYLEMKALEEKSPRSAFMYWIEPTLICYL